MSVLLIRPTGNENDAVALRDHGIDSLIEPYLSINPAPNQAGANRMVTALENGTAGWLLVTSPNALGNWDLLLDPSRLSRALHEAPQLRCAAVGNSTATQLRDRGARAVAVPEVQTGRGLLSLFTAMDPETVVMPIGDLADPGVAQGLTDLGFEVVSEVVYETREVGETPTTASNMPPEVEVVLLRSPSAARAFARFTGTKTRPVFCAGPTTAAAATTLGLRVIGMSENPDSPTVARALAASLNSGGLHD